MIAELETRVRLAGRGDAVMLHLLASATFPLACSPGTPAADVAAHIAENLSVERFRTRLESDRRTLFIGEIGGTPAGYAMVSHSTAVPEEVAKLLTKSPAVELSRAETPRPDRVLTSIGLTPAAITLTRNSALVVAGCCTSATLKTSGSPVLLMTTARIVLIPVASPPCTPQ